MSLLRTFWKVTRYARAARFWLLLALAALAWVGFGGSEAHAQVKNCAQSGSGCTKEEAYQSCRAMRANYIAAWPDNYRIMVDCVDQVSAFTWSACRHPAGNPDSCLTGTTGTTFHLIASGCPGGTVWFGGSVGRCDTACNARPTQTTLFAPKPGSISCERGCMRSFMANGDGETMTTQSTGQQCTGTLEEACAAIPPENGNYVRNPLLGVCEPVTAECPEGMKPVNGKCEVNDFCPAGQVLNEQSVCVPQEGECPAGTARDLQGMCRSQDDDGDPNKCPAGQVTGSDGTCKPDANDDGEPDDGTDTGTFSGGDSCKVPPMCSGDAIMCGQARIQWRIDCNTRRNQNISGGACSPRSQPVCVGESCDLMQYAQLMQAWHTRCAVEKLATGAELPPGDGTGDPDYDAAVDGNAAVDALPGDAAPLELATPDSIFTDESENNDGAGGPPGGTGELDSSGLGFQRGCVNLPSVNVFGTVVDFNSSGGVLCDWMRLGGQFVLILAALLSVRILSSGSSV